MRSEVHVCQNTDTCTCTYCQFMYSMCVCIPSVVQLMSSIALFSSVSIAVICLSINGASTPNTVAFNYKQ